MKTDVAIIGGGLAGLTAAIYTARAGLTVTLFEKSARVGGRAITNNLNDFNFNLGPHALYLGGAGAEALRELGVKFTGGKPGAGGGLAIYEGKKYRFPGTLFSLLTTGLFDFPAKLDVGKLFLKVGKIDAKELMGVTVEEWLENETRHPHARKFIETMLRLTTYSYAPELQSAGAALEQLQLSLKSGVIYLDYGWQTLVNELRNIAAKMSNLRIVTGERVASVERNNYSWTVLPKDAREFEASTAVLAVSPSEAASILANTAAEVSEKWKNDCIPVKAACLDLGLRRLPEDGLRFALGIDKPLYLSIHSSYAKLAPSGMATVNLAKYLKPGLSEDAKAIEREFEELLDLTLPGWRKELVERRFLPQMTVINALVTAAQKGAKGRPPVNATELEGLFLAGDWVGDEGQLSDASFASARRAADLICQRLQAKSVVAV